MDFLRNLKNLGDQIWEPVLKPVRSPTCGDTLGLKYVSNSENTLYRRQDGTVSSLEEIELRFTCYLRYRPAQRTFQSSLSLEDEQPAPCTSTNKKDLFTLISSIEGKCTFIVSNRTEINEGPEDWDLSMDTFLLYLHSHGASRQEGRFLLDFVEMQNANLCVCDMRASGQSGGEFCTLGIKESGDVLSTIRELEKRYNMKRLILYGRSMGAVSVMKFISEFQESRCNFQTKPKQKSKVSFWTRPMFQLKTFSTILFRSG